MLQTEQLFPYVIEALRSAFEVSHSDLHAGYKCFIQDQTDTPLNALYPAQKKRPFEFIQHSHSSWRPKRKHTRYASIIKSEDDFTDFISDNELLCFETVCEMDKRHIVSTFDRFKGAGLNRLQWKTIFNWATNLSVVLHLPKSTTAIGMSIIDRYLLKHAPGDTIEFREIAAAGMLIAAKMDAEVYFDQAAFATGSRVPYENILRTESKILNVLNWNVNVVTAYEITDLMNTYVLRTAVMDNEKKDFLNSQDMLLERAIQNIKLASIRASSVAVACTLITLAFLDHGKRGFRHLQDLLRIAQSVNLSMYEIMMCIDILMESIKEK